MYVLAGSTIGYGAIRAIPDGANCYDKLVLFLVESLATVHLCQLSLCDMSYIELVSSVMYVHIRSSVGFRGLGTV